MGERSGKAEEAMQFYTSLFQDARIDAVTRYGKDEAPEIEGTVKHASFQLNGQEFIAMDSNLEHGFTFSEAISFIIDCKDQKEVDFFWEKFTEGGEEGLCGWLKDKFGVSWQVIPAVLPEMLQDRDPEKSQRVMKAMLQMKKIDIERREQAYKK